MQRVLRLILVVLLSSLTACQIRPTRISRTAEASAQSTGEKTLQQFTLKRTCGALWGHRIYFHQDVSTSHSVATDFEPTGTCLYTYPGGYKQPCLWDRSTDRITVRVTDGDTLPLRLADDELTYLKRDGAGGGVCIKLAKNRAVSDPDAGFCQGAMGGLPLPPK
jgi:hypothetical protein